MYQIFFFLKFYNFCFRIWVHWAIKDNLHGHKVKIFLYDVMRFAYYDLNTLWPKGHRVIGWHVFLHKTKCKHKLASYVTKVFNNTLKISILTLFFIISGHLRKNVLLLDDQKIEELPIILHQISHSNQEQWFHYLPSFKK